MDFAEALAREMVASQKPCKVTKILNVMSDEDSAAVRAALANPDVQTTAILRALNTTGHKVGSSTLSRHRRGGCTCD